jgi:FMN phosphatase YigB (HAD superfamily)
MLKPDAKIYNAVLADINSTPDVCLFIDDRQANVDAANEAGLPALRFTSFDNLVKELMRKNVIAGDQFSHNNLLGISSKL